mmetsp:Transcript_35483/g.33660  ORF Transcript_35483/g.33660 Transcript_35483/m.33660 type:complete len:304 (+) Transcript_35483:84-995(+)
MIYVCLIVLILTTCNALNISPSRVKGPSSVKNQVVISDRDVLLEAIQGLNYGIKASKSDSENIESYVQALILSSKQTVKLPADAFALTNGGNNKYQRSVLSGDWELLYTQAPDIINISKIPGVRLDYVGQVVDTEENSILNLVKSSGFLADTEQEISVDIRQVSPTRVELDFTGTKIQLTKIFNQEKIFGKNVNEIKPFEIKFKKEDFEKAIKNSGKPIPAFEIEYIDDTLRIQRTSEGYLYILKKDAVETGVNPGTTRSPGLGPWLTDKIGDKGMLALGAFFLTPYLFFANTAIQEYLSSIR